MQLLVEASAGQMPVVILDPKGSPVLEATVRAHGGQVWALDGRMPADLMDPRPWQVPDLLLEAEDYSTDARVFRDAIFDSATLVVQALEPVADALIPSAMRLECLHKLLTIEQPPQFGEVHRLAVERQSPCRPQRTLVGSGARGLDRALGVLLDGVAMRGSLRSCPEALRLEDVLDTRGLGLFSLDVADYPHATRKVASWVLLGMGRLARQLQEAEIVIGPDSHGSGPRALLLVD